MKLNSILDTLKMSNEFRPVLSIMNNWVAQYVIIRAIRCNSDDHKTMDVFKATRPVRPAGNL